MEIEILLMIHWVLSSRGDRKGFRSWRKVARDMELLFCFESFTVIRKWEMRIDLTTGQVRSPRQLSSSMDISSMFSLTHPMLCWTPLLGARLQSTCIHFPTIVSVF